MDRIFTLPNWNATITNAGTTTSADPILATTYTTTTTTAHPDPTEPPMIVWSGTHLDPQQLFARPGRVIYVDGPPPSGPAFDWISEAEAIGRQAEIAEVLQGQGLKYAEVSLPAHIEPVPLSDLLLALEWRSGPAAAERLMRFMEA